MPQYGGDAERRGGALARAGRSGRRAVDWLRSVLQGVRCLFDIPCQKENMEQENDTVHTRRQPAVYRVQREIQTEEHVQALLERNLPSTFGGEPQIPEKKTRLRCRFSWESFKKIIYKRFPVLNWLFSYQFREWILKDLHAGLNVGLVQVPQDFCFLGLLGIWLAGLPLPMINGFLSAFCCSMLYMVFGSSHHISIGSFSILNLVVKNILKSLDLNKTLSFNSSLVNFSDPILLKDYMEILTLTASVTFMTGIIQLLLGCFCLKSVTAYLPKALIDAYLSAAALLVIVSQFTFIFDVVLDFHRSSRDIFCNVFYYFLALPKSNATSILVFLLSMAILQISKTIRITYMHSPVAFPMELLLIITATIIANCIHLHAESSSAVVSRIPQRFLPPTLPDLSNLSKIILHAFSLATVSCFLLVFIGEKYALLHNYNISSSQELIAVGLCNICSAFFRSFAVSCAISGTVIQEKTGGRTQIAALMGASIMLVIALKLGHFFWVIPNSVLAAIVVFNVLPFLEKFLDIPTLWRKDKYHLAIWVGTFAAVLRLGLDIGLLIALAIAFFIISIRSHRMRMVELGQIPNTNIYRSLSICRAAVEIDGVKIFQCCSSISFANMNNFKNYLLHKMDMKTVPLNPHEMRALVSASLSDTSVASKDFKCSCVCDPPLPPPRIPYTEKLVKSCHIDSTSTSSSVNLVRWSKYGVRQNHGMLLLGAANAKSASPGINTQLQPEKNEDEEQQTGVSLGSAVGNASAQLDREEQSVHLPGPVHTIILDFSMVQFVDLQGSDLLRQIFHMFFNIGITVLIAGCHSSVIAAFEKNEFFDSFVTKEMFFLTLHDALLAALAKHQKPDERELTTEENAEKLRAKDEMDPAWDKEWKYNSNI
ncbi:testis anion transporter 1 isoform X6 [Gallus gallus]|uniref:testis anion transporter 1 isoform X6 n=1 Tax=Gallus gallus TaxID=9031 RepID=UPI001AE80D98|nr:testis anion transporter 1 isoform X6 [Gallus gallus]XP_040508720.1 testis anion transporter 1 isoform X6 [Gallus gallus]XP_040508721.1 testis anion transporter 1 isoform X6 [Gallus gallus]